MAGDPSPRRFAVRAALLLLPVVVAALLIPRLYRGAGAPPRPGAQAPGPGEAAPPAPAPATSEAAPAQGPLDAAAKTLGALTGTAPSASTQAGASSADPAAPPPRRDGPTIEEIEAARAAEEALARAREGWRKVEFMAPREGKAAAAGERVVPFQGFGLSVDTVPSGAAVSVNGKALGTAPVLTSFPCRPGEAITIAVSLPQHATRSRQVRCRADELVSITIPFGR